MEFMERTMKALMRIMNLGLRELINARYLHLSDRQQSDGSHLLMCHSYEENVERRKDAICLAIYKKTSLLSLPVLVTIIIMNK